MDVGAGFSEYATCGVPLESKAMEPAFNELFESIV